MMAGPIATTRRLVDLGEIAERENLFPHDPWGVEPDYPDGVAAIVYLDLSGTIRRVHVDDPVDWTSTAGYRFETPLGEIVNGFDIDGDYEPDDDGDDDPPPSADATSGEDLTRPA